MLRVWPGLRRSAGSRRGAGQALIVMVGVMLLSIALLAAIIDGGNVLVQQRENQTGSDGAAEAGAILLASRLAGAVEPAGGWDANIDARVQETAAANNMSVKAAYYTDICGVPLRADGTAAVNGDGTENLAAALEVGATGNLPTDIGLSPDCTAGHLGPVAGLMVIGQQDVKTFVARAIAINSIQVTTRATAVAGYLQGYCDASQGVWCAVLPVTIPGFVPQCGNNGTLNNGGSAWQTGVVYTIGLCRNDPGNVGWIDWTPPGGGSNELVCSIVNPNNPSIDLPEWMYISGTGDPNGGGPCTDSNTGITYSGIQDAIRKYDGQVVVVPQFSSPTCNPGPNRSPDPNQVGTPVNYGCGPADQGGSGVNQWYRITSFAFLQLCEPSMAGCNGHDGAYIQGDNTAVCGQGNGQTGCLIGKLVDIMGSGTVGPGNGSGTGTKAVGVQLIR